jgi:hypothetical protein
VLALSFHTKNSLETIKILEMARGAFGVDLTIIICVIGVCLRELKGIWIILIAECGPRNEEPKGGFRNYVPNSDKYKRIEDKNEVRHL